MEDRPAWPLEELTRRAALALRSVPGARPPDARAVRWYAGIGLVDRPVGGRGRGARYGPRHLWQLVAVRRLQAEGWSLADIQGRLAGAPDDALRAVAALPEIDLNGAASAPAAAVDAAIDGAVDLAVDVAAPLRAPASPPSTARLDAAFWRPGAEVRYTPTAAHPPHPARALGAVELAEGVVLVLSQPPRPADLPALAEAAVPLLAALAALGLAPVPSSTVPGGSS